MVIPFYGDNAASDAIERRVSRRDMMRARHRQLVTTDDSNTHERELLRESLARISEQSPSACRPRSSIESRSSRCS